jgi:cytochrome c
VSSLQAVVTDEVLINLGDDMRTAFIVLAAAGLIVAGGARAQSGAEVVKSKCSGCHDMEAKKAGPSWKDIAAKYKGNKDASATLVTKLKEGKGHMKVSASDAELSAAVQYALAAK